MLERMGLGVHAQIIAHMCFGHDGRRKNSRIKGFKSGS